MNIYYNDTKLDIEVNDNSYRYRAIKGEHSLTLYFSLPQHVEIPVGAWCVFEAERYELVKPSNFKKNNTRNFDYTLIMESQQAKLRKYKFRNTVDRRLKFSYTARPHEHLQMLVDNMNLRDSGWSVGECIDAVEKVISYNHAFCADALTQMADEFETEYEVVGKKIHLHKVEYNKTNPLPLSYGKGNGFKPGIGRANYDDSKPTEVLYVQGGEENIDASKYGRKELLLPKNATLRYDGTHFDGEAGFEASKARTYLTDADGFSLRRSDKPLITSAENSLDCSHIYPKRVGGISKVEVVNAAKNFYDFIDNTIPADLNYNDCIIGGETMTVIFQSGMLAGKEFEVKYYHESKTINGVFKAARRFEIVPQDIDGVTMPNNEFKPVAGQDTYAVFNISLPAAYVCNNATKSGASWDMFREAAKYLYENEEQKFTFTGELDGTWAKRDWLNIGGKIRLGGYILFSDTQFQPEGVAIRIVGIKDYINKPHSPEIELSNQVIGSSFTSTLGKIEENEVVMDDNRKEALQFTKRRFRDAIETMSMLNDAMLDNFSNSINPLTVQTMAMLVGDESLQFRFVNNKTNPTEVSHNVTYNQTTKVLNIPSGIIQHLTLGINTISAEHKAAEYKFWSLPQFNTPPLVDGTKQYYLYAKVSTTDQTGSFYISEKAVKIDEVNGFYHLLMGVLNSEFDEARSYVSLYGFTEILPGRITTDRIVSSDGKTYFDLTRDEIGGNIKFLNSGGSLKDIATLDKETQAAEIAAAEAMEKAIESNKRLTDWASDGVVSPTEKPALRIEMESIKAEYQEIYDQVNRYNLSSGDAWANFYSAYNKAVVALTKYTASSPEILIIDLDYLNISDYYPNRQNILQEISKASKLHVDSRTPAVVNLIYQSGNYSKNDKITHWNSFNDNISFKKQSSIIGEPDKPYFLASEYNKEYRYIISNAIRLDKGEYMLSFDFVGESKSTFSTVFSFFRQNDDTTIVSLMDVVLPNSGKYNFSIVIETAGNYKLQFCGISTDLLTGTRWFGINKVMLAKGNTKCEWSPNPIELEAKALASNYLSEAMTGSTEISGGLVLSNLIAVKDSKKTGPESMTAGMSGLSSDNINIWADSDGGYSKAISFINGLSTDCPNFLVTKNGTLYSKSGEIGGLAINTNSLSKGDNFFITAEKINKISDFIGQTVNIKNINNLLYNEPSYTTDNIYHEDIIYTFSNAKGGVLKINPKINTSINASFLEPYPISPYQIVVVSECSIRLIGTKKSYDIASLSNTGVSENTNSIQAIINQVEKEISFFIEPDTYKIVVVFSANVVSRGGKAQISGGSSNQVSFMPVNGEGGKVEIVTSNSATMVGTNGFVNHQRSDKYFSVNNDENVFVDAKGDVSLFSSNGMFGIKITNSGIKKIVNGVEDNL